SDSLGDVIISVEAKIVSEANRYLLQSPVPITSFTCKRSVGGIHDFYSEGDYWWENPEDPNGPYIRRDGKSNPNNFVEHRKAMRNLNKWVSTLVAAYEMTNNEKYAVHALKHLEAFFINKNTLMNPNLLFAQAIKGKATGRGIGIIDTIHLIEVAKAIEKLAASNFLKGEKLLGLKDWFEQYAVWMNSHPYGLKEKDHGNNHSTWWTAQLAAFSHLAQREDLMEVARANFKKLISSQMDEDGSFIDEITRTKPYIYMLFNLEGYSTLCQIASTEEEDLWNYEGKNGGVLKAWNFMLPFIKDKSKWIKPPDIQYYEQVPIQSPGLLFAAIAYQNTEFLQVWKSLSPERKSEEINRNFPIREPLIWVN
ncbi:alginate lyase family protein, partial [Saprospiraceae bacterium]|nr:alginate lyase family protein [Saprospiraceae bacterium]